MNKLALPALVISAFLVPLPATGQTIAPRPPPQSWVITATALQSRSAQQQMMKPAPEALIGESAFRVRRRQGTTTMIIGAAAMLAGVLTDESALTLVGAGVAGVGLYLYIR